MGMGMGMVVTATGMDLDLSIGGKRPLQEIWTDGKVRGKEGEGKLG